MVIYSVNAKKYIRGMALMLLGCVASSVYADEPRKYYKTYDEQGQVVFTDVKPSSEQPVEELSPSQDISVISSGVDAYAPNLFDSYLETEGEQNLDRIYSQLGMTPEQYERLTDEEKAYLKEQGFELPELEPETTENEIDPKTAYEEALERQQAGKEPSVSDWQRTVKGRRFLKPEYFERQKKLQDDVDEAKQNID